MTDNLINDGKKETYFSDNESDDELVSDRVHILANGVYQEFESLIKKHGPGTVDGLMPLIVSILETMDKLYTYKDEMSIQVELIREDQRELYSQYEREKTCRRLAEEKINRIEDQFEEEKRLLEERIEFIESNNKIMEMRSRNCRDLIIRMEEKEVEIRKEYSILQMRYSDLLKNKIDYSTKYRSLNSQCPTEDDQLSRRSPGSEKRSEKPGKVELILENKSKDMVDIDEIDSALGEIKLLNETDDNELCLKDEFKEVEQMGENFQFGNEDFDFYMNEEPSLNSITTAENFNNDEDVSMMGEFDDLIMGKEIEFLIKENQDLVETKTALNIVKDDLINKLDEMTGEMCILQEDLTNSIKLNKEFKTRVKNLEKKIDEMNDSLKLKDRRLMELGDEENVIEYSKNVNGFQMKTRFTRAEVTKILHERNKYKEELLELQETLRYQSTLLNKGPERTKKGTIWKIFSNVLSNATAFTTEAFIGSGNEMTIGQLNRNFSSNHNKVNIENEHGTRIQLPTISQNSPSKINRNKGRRTNPLLNHLCETKKASSFDFVPIDAHISSLQQCDSYL